MISALEIAIGIWLAVMGLVLATIVALALVDIITKKMFGMK